MDLAVRRLRRMRMETENDGRFIRATMRMLPGACTESLALAVAAACRVPDEVVSRAESHYAVRISRYDRQLMDMSPPPAACPTRPSAVRSRTTRCVSAPNVIKAVRSLQPRTVALRGEQPNSVCAARGRGVAVRSLPAGSRWHPPPRAGWRGRAPLSARCSFSHCQVGMSCQDGSLPASRSLQPKSKIRSWPGHSANAACCDVATTNVMRTAQKPETQNHVS